MNTSEQARVRYEAMVATRNTELSAHWTRYNVFGAIHAGLMVGLVNINRDGPLADVALTGAGLLGLCLAVSWALVTWRGYFWIEFWNGRLVATEVLLRGSEFQLAQRAVTAGGVTLKEAASVPPAVFAAAWLCVLLHGMRPTVLCYLR